MAEPTAGSNLIVNELLDETDDRPVWLQAWGGTNTIARALKTIEETHPEKMATVANKLRFFFIWEQDNTYQAYIKPHWGKYNIQTIISDQFVAFFYTWNRTMPPAEKKFYEADWMNANILKNHGPLCSLYAAHDGTKKKYQAGDFRSEGDTPSFLHNIPNGLRSMESPDWGGWGGRYVRVRENTWLDPVEESDYQYPGGRWYTNSAWGRQRLNVQPGSEVKLSAKGTSDPDGDALTYRWWQYQEADSYTGIVSIHGAEKQQASFIVPKDAGNGNTIHVICEVTDSGSPPLTRYQRVVVEIQ